MAVNYAVEGDLPLFYVTVKARSTKAIQDLTNLTTRTLRWWQGKGPVSTATMSLDGAATLGQLQYQSLAADWPDGAGCESEDISWEVLLSDGTSPHMVRDENNRPFTIRVMKRQ